MGLSVQGMKIDAAFNIWTLADQHSKKGYESFSRLARLLNCDWLKLLAGGERYRDYLNILVIETKNAPLTSSSVGGEEERHIQHLYLMSICRFRVLLQVYDWP